MYIGIDTGYEFLKDSNGNIFRSACTDVEPLSLFNKKININGKDYWYGIGKTVLDVDKAESEVNRVCALTSLAMAEDTHFKVVVGLPIAQYQTDKEKLKDIVMSYSGAIVRLGNGPEKVISIKDCYVFSQGLSALHVADIKEDCIIVDVGSRTVDVALVRWKEGTPTIAQYNTYYCGSMSLYSKLAAAINTEYKLTISADDVVNILTNGLYVYGEYLSIGFLSNVFRQHFEAVLNDLQLNYPSQTTPFVLMGGGATLLYNAIKNRFKNVTILDNSQFINANGYKIIGEMVFNA